MPDLQHLVFYKINFLQISTLQSLHGRWWDLRYIFKRSSFLHTMKQVREMTYVVIFDTCLSLFLLKECLFLHSVDMLNKFISQDLVFCNDSVVNSDCDLVAGDVIRFLTPQELEPPVQEKYDILYEDEFLFVVNKPAQLPVHPVGKYYFNTLTKILERDGFSNQGKLFPIHRIDKETSGIVLFAKTNEVAKKLQLLFSGEGVEKIYLGIIMGVLPQLEGVFSWSLRQIDTDLIRNTVIVAKDGKLAKTTYRVLEFVEEFSLIRLKLSTGRKHQIRVHLATAGTPLVGDKQYGSYPDLFLKVSDNPFGNYAEIEKKLFMSRQALHCAEISFLHPFISKKMTFRSKLPADMLSFLNSKGFKKQVLF